MYEEVGKGFEALAMGLSWCLKCAMVAVHLWQELAQSLADADADHVLCLPNSLDGYKLV